MRVLIIRPEREATALAAALAERGHVPVIAPLFGLEFLQPPAEFAAGRAGRIWGTDRGRGFFLSVV